jgi:RNA:NAD 2'-phosphotransferase (TPT1/KptA family)
MENSKAYKKAEKKAAQFSKSLTKVLRHDAVSLGIVI